MTLLNERWEFDFKIYVRRNTSAHCTHDVCYRSGNVSVGQLNDTVGFLVGKPISSDNDHTVSVSGILIQLRD